MRHASLRAEFDFNARKVVVDGRSRPVRGKPFELLKLLLRNKARVVTYEEVGRELFGSAFEPDNVRQVAKRLRKQLGSDKLVRTERGVGFQWHDAARTDDDGREDAQSATAREGEADLAASFYGGGPARRAHILNSFDVSRSQLAGRKDSLAREHESCWWETMKTQMASAEGLKLIAVVGPAGSGKTTLCLRLMTMFENDGANVVDALEGVEALTEIRLTSEPASSSRLFIISKLHNVFHTDECRQLAAWVRLRNTEGSNVTLVLAADSNHWRVYEALNRRASLGGIATWMCGGYGTS